MSQMDTPAVDNFIIRLGSSDDPLVTISRDGTVTIHREGADKEAARVFWDSIHQYGKTIMQEIEEAKLELHYLKQKERDRIDRLSIRNAEMQFELKQIHERRNEGLRIIEAQREHIRELKEALEK